VLGGAVAACGSKATASVVPSPGLSGTRDAQREFRRIESKWEDLPPERRAELAGDLRRFLSTHADDDRARSVRLRLAWVEMQAGHFAEARTLVAIVQKGPPGAVRDFANVVAAAIFRREGNLSAALALLEPLRGKIADPEERSVHAAELVSVLVAASRYDEALVAMLDWAEQAPQADREDVVASIEGLVRAMPPAALEAGLATLSVEDRADPAGKRSTRSEARLWLLSTARARLVRVALTERDPGLARRLIDSSAVHLGRDESRDALAALAATSVVAPRVAGRAVGVVLDVEDEVARRRSAELVEGMTRALGLPAAATRKDAVRLLTEDASEEGDVERALSGLAGDGAAILVAGVTDEGAVAASLFAERTRLPVIVLRQAAGLGTSAHTFVLGTDASSEEAAVSEAVSGLGSHVFRVGPGGAPCDVAPAAAGQTRFPVQEWKRGGIDALVLSGDAECTRDATTEVAGYGLAPLLVFGLESGEIADTIPGQKVVVRAGRFPFDSRSLADDERAWVERWGSPPSWYETLGHDASLLVSAALAGFPLERADDERVVASLHSRAREALLHVEAPLWSTAARGFAGRNAVSRELHAAAPSGEAGPHR
jgi:hypothetical protein